MRWMELVDDQRVFLLRLEPDIWAEIERGTLTSLELLRPGRNARRPEFRRGDVLLLYHPERPTPGAASGARTGGLSHAVAVRSESSNDTGYGLGPLCRMKPSLARERLLFAAQRGVLPDLFRRPDELTFTLQLLTSDQRDWFLEYVVNAGVALKMEGGKGRPPVPPPLADAPGIVEFEW